MRIFMVTAALVVIALPSSATSAGAAERLGGRWVSDSLRDNGIGYYLVLRPTSDRTYAGQLRFQYRDGRRNAPMPVSVVVTGGDAIITAREGRFDKSGRTLRARIDSSRVLTLVNCSERLSLVMSWDLASDCTLRLKP